MIKIEVTGNSIPEVADKLLAIGSSLRAQVLSDANTAAAIAMQAERDAAREVMQKKIKKAKAEAAVAEPVAEPAVEEVEVEEAVVGQPETDETATLSYTKDVMPAVLRAVETQGRERVVALLGSMGVDKASQLPESRWPELMKALNA
jgi:flagellar biosynthesis GTPase FlhF